MHAEKQSNLLRDLSALFLRIVSSSRARRSSTSATGFTWGAQGLTKGPLLAVARLPVCSWLQQGIPLKLVHRRLRSPNTLSFLKRAPWHQGQLSPAADSESQLARRRYCPHSSKTRFHGRGVQECPGTMPDRQHQVLPKGQQQFQ